MHRARHFPRSKLLAPENDEFRMKNNEQKIPHTGYVWGIFLKQLFAEIRICQAVYPQLRVPNEAYFCFGFIIKILLWVCRRRLAYRSRKDARGWALRR